MAMAANEIETLIKEALPDADVQINDLRGDGDHYAAYARPPPSSVDLRYPPRWTLRDRFVDRGSGDVDWMLGELSGGAKPKLPALLVYVRV